MFCCVLMICYDTVIHLDSYSQIIINFLDIRVVVDSLLDSGRRSMDACVMDGIRKVHQ